MHRHCKKRYSFIGAALLAGIMGIAAAEQEQPMEWTGAEKKIAITFDDGPHPCYTALLLDGLQARQVPATFFIIGEKAGEYPELIRRMKQEGHLIGNHTYSHAALNQIGHQQACNEIQKANQLIEEICGEVVMYLRPPYGAWERKKECPQEMLAVYWDVDPLDWKRRDVEGIAADVLCRVQPGDVILLHDVYESSVQAAFQIVDELLNRGYTFVTVEELLFP